MKLPRALFAFLMLLSAWPTTIRARGGVVPHPVPWEFASARYSVSVNGKPVGVFFATMNLHFANFDFSGEAEVRVTIEPDDYNRKDGKTYPAPDDFWQGGAIVRPLSRGVLPKTEGREVTFRITRPGQYAIERPRTGGFEDEVLFLFANAPERNVPARTDKNVIWLDPGLHQRSVDLTSGQTLYLAPGAVLFGAVNVWNAENARITGRGTVVYSGPVSRNVDSGWMNRPNWRPLTTHAARGLRVEGVTFVNRSRTWTIQLWETWDAVFDNIKILASAPENLNCDGIDWYGGGEATVRDSFIRSADDCFAFYTAASSEAFRTDRGAGGHLPGAPRAVTPETLGEVRDITIERCVLWPTIANIARAGWLNQSLTTRRIITRDCDVIHMGTREKPWMNAHRALFSAVSSNGKGDCLHEAWRFENIRIEDSAALLGINWPGTTLRDFAFKDITFREGANPNNVRGNLDGVRFENIRLGSEIARDATMLQLAVEGDAKGIVFSAQ